MKNKHGIAVMRLQPLHNGHVRLIRTMLDECLQVTILIGSSQESHTDKNPFTIFERKRMLKNILPDIINLIPIKDINNPEAWVAYVLGTVVKNYPYFPIPDAYYTGSEEDAKEFLSSPIKTFVFERNSLSATQIRDSMLKGDDEWRQHIPDINHPIIENYLKRVTT